MNSRPLASWARGWVAAACITAAYPVAAANDALGQWLARRGEGPPAPAATATQAPDATADLVIAAMNFLDHRYQAGGQSVETGFDCSGFTRHLFSQTLGVELPRRVDEQAHDRALHHVPRDQLRAGDLVFFNTLRRTFSHVGIYLGDGRFIHAPRSGAQIRIESLSAAYWSRRFTGARRAVVADEAHVSPADR